MSTYAALTRHPDTGIVEPALWIDDYFWRHNYGVRFADGNVFDVRDFCITATYGFSEYPVLTQPVVERRKESNHDKGNGRRVGDVNDVQSEMLYRKQF